MFRLAEPFSSALASKLGRRWVQAMAWCVHAYTALGLVAAAAMAILIVRGDAIAFRWVFFWMLIALFIDATDGVLARALRVKEHLPGFDGRRLDDIIDFMTYTALPLLLIWRAGILPAGQEPWLLVPLVASAYGFCQVEAKTDDGYFLGFPSYWNIVAFYLYVLHFHVVPLPGTVSIGLLLTLAILTFIPSRYLYPSFGGRLSRLTNVLGAIWAGLILWIWLMLPTRPDSSRQAILLTPLVLLSLAFPLYYLAASWLISWRLRQSRRTGRPYKLGVRSSI